MWQWKEAHFLFDRQWFFHSRNVGWVTPEIIYFRYLKKRFLDRSIQKNILLNFEKEVLVIKETKTHRP